MTELLKYDNGLRVVVNTVRGVRSVASGFWVGVGSAYESDENNGLSHFTEHVTFKGTDDLSAFDIAHRFESYGAAFNAFTSKECTCYYAKSIDEYAENCFALLGEILLRSVYARSPPQARPVYLFHKVEIGRTEVETSSIENDGAPAFINFP